MVRVRQMCRVGIHSWQVRRELGWVVVIFTFRSPEMSRVVGREDW